MKTQVALLQTSDEVLVSSSTSEEPQRGARPAVATQPVSLCTLRHHTSNGGCER